MQSPLADLEKKFAERHRVIFGTVETVRGEVVRAVEFPDLGFFIAGAAMRKTTLEQAMKFADQFAAPKKIERPDATESTLTCPCPRCVDLRAKNPELVALLRS